MVKALKVSTRQDRKSDGHLHCEEYLAPWTLKVSQSWVFPFLVNSKSSTLIRDSQDKYDAAESGIGYMMLIRYSDSPAGPYDELLIGYPMKEPSELRINKDEWFPPYRISSIWVSTERSLRNGRKNWGIRKELADFEWKQVDGFLYSNTLVRVLDRISGRVLLTTSFQTLNYPFFPVHLGLLGKWNPAIIEKRIDEDGKSVGEREWLKIRTKGLLFCFPHVICV